MPLFRLYQYSNAVGCKTRDRLELAELEILYGASEQKISEHVFFFFFFLVGVGGVGPCMAKLCPFFDSVIKSCQHDILRTARARILIYIWHMAWDQCLDDLITFERIP